MPIPRHGRVGAHCSGRDSVVVLLVTRWGRWGVIRGADDW